MVKNYVFVVASAAIYVGYLVYKDRKLRACVALTCNGTFKKNGEVAITNKSLYQIYRCQICSKIYEKSTKTKYEYKEFESFELIDQIKRKLNIPL